MHLEINWGRPIGLNGARQGTGYWLDLSKIASDPGVYVFGRKHVTKFEALYVGRANNVRGRVKGQLNNLRLMNHVKYAKQGKRILLFGHFDAKPGQQQSKCLPLIERALIQYFLSEGHDLVNKQGTRLRRHEVASSGKHPKRYFSRLIYVE